MARGNSIAEEIKSKCNIVDVIGRVVPLKKAGINYSGRCPFHNEKTPSFMVSEQKQTYTCFGCNEHGDVISFVSKYYNLDFMQAVEKLASEYGITLNYDTFRKDTKKELFYEINREAALFFHKVFTESANPGYDYMRGRGIEPKTLKRFGIGYADEKWDSLLRHLTQKGYSKEDLLSLGLISRSGEKYFDKFRDRVMFPIINTRGKVIGFGGRVLGDATPKYLNSPETPVFQKKNNLYGLNLARQAIGKENCAILVEGYMDVIALHQAGVENVSASLGTALTEYQAALLRRYADKVILSYDADSAGRAAALRGLDILHKEGIHVRVLHVTDGKDPDEFVKKNGKEAFYALTKNALSYAEYKIEHIRQEVDLSGTEGQLEFLKRTIDVLRQLTPTEADFHIRKIASEMKVSEGAIRMELYGSEEGQHVLPTRLPQNRQGRRENSDSGEKPVSSESAGEEAISALERHLLKIVLTDASYYHKVAVYSYIFRNHTASAVWEAIRSVYREETDLSRDDVREQLEPEEQAAFDDLMENTVVAGCEEQIYLDSVRKIGFNELRTREREIGTLLALADESGDDSKIRDLTEELMEIQKLVNEQGGMQQ